MRYVLPIFPFKFCVDIYFLRCLGGLGEKAPLGLSAGRQVEPPAMDDETVWASYELTGVLTHQVRDGGIWRDGTVTVCIGGWW